MLDSAGYAHFPRAFESADLLQLLEAHDNGQAGERIANCEPLSDWLSHSPEVAGLLGKIGHVNSRPVRAILFDKGPTTNWVLGWHQDRTICVKKRVETEGYGPFTTKAGLVHVEPPFELIEGMATVRFHLDPVDGSNAPLRIAVGSHKVGKIPAREVEAIARRSDIVACYAEAGDTWAYSTPILHSSERSQSAGQRRRVLQVDFSPDSLKGGLDWLGI
ncbi:phytanoyl-CoA dioxygenase family protein [Citromicrobium bathyomarinum]|uniref:phytanoyl-CoA dioxygenase family protein n=1 Tax=Sphingomonadales TaxID=204457 RepID=UPI001A404105|nr:phytanoyl-CoA dioxygenase family protein [Citromicrobium sp.]